MENHYRKLEQEGWTRQSILDEPRLSECAELYQSLGFEVLLEPLRPECLEGECSTCMCGSDKYKVIFTRKKEE